LEFLGNLPIDEREKAPELDGALLRVALADDFAGCDVESGKEVGRAVAIVGRCGALRLPEDQR
jgi:hypothetical protein